MPQAGNVVLADRAATPVNHTFSPRSIGGEVALFVEPAAAAIGEKKLTCSTRKTGSRYKVRVVLANPILVNETINGVSVPSVQRTAYADVTFTFEETSSLQERKDTVGMFANALLASQTVLDPFLTNLEGIW